MNVTTELKLCIDTREEGKSGGKYYEFEVGDDIRIVTQDGNDYCGCVEGIESNSLTVYDTDNDEYVEVKFYEIAEVYEY